MQTKNANAVRELYVSKLFALMGETEEVGMITSGSFNFPIVAEDGEEGWVEIVVKVPKEDEGYALRDEYNAKLTAKAEKAKASAEKKAKKIAEDKAKREAKAKAKAEREG